MCYQISVEPGDNPGEKCLRITFEKAELSHSVDKAPPLTFTFQEKENGEIGEWSEGLRKLEMLRIHLDGSNRMTRITGVAKFAPEVVNHKAMEELEKKLASLIPVQLVPWLPDEAVVPGATWKSHPKSPHPGTVTYIKSEKKEGKVLQHLQFRRKFRSVPPPKAGRLDLKGKAFEKMGYSSESEERTECTLLAADKMVKSVVTTAKQQIRFRNPKTGVEENIVSDAKATLTLLDIRQLPEGK